MHHIPVAFVMTSPLGNREQASVEKRGHASAAYRSVESQSVKNEWMEHRETGAGWNNGERSELRRVPKHLYAKQGAEMDLGAPVGGRSACLRVISAGQFDAEDKNNASLCLLLDFGAQVLLLGDQEEEGCLNLEGIRAPLELLKCAHHGSAHGTSQQLLNRLKPDHAVISVGADNRYGHPDAHTLLRLKQSGARIERTDEQGSLTYLRHPFSRGLVVQNEAQMRTWSALRWGLVILDLIFWEGRMQKLSPWKRLV